MTKYGEYFLILLLVTLFGLLLVYITHIYQAKKVEKFYQTTCDMQKMELDKKQKENYIISQEQMALVQGINLPGNPISPVLAFDSDPSAASIDGDPSSKSQLFMLAFNKFAPECCPSAYSSSSGCACMTDKQMDWIGQRGNNSRIAKCVGDSEY